MSSRFSTSAIQLISTRVPLLVILGTLPVTLVATASLTIASGCARSGGAQGFAPTSSAAPGGAASAGVLTSTSGAASGAASASLSTISLGAAAHGQNGQSSNHSEAHYLSIMSFNVNWARLGDGESIRVIRRARPDIVVLQETNGKWEFHLREQLGDIYPYMAFHNAELAGGLAILSRFPYKTLAYIPSPLRKFPAWLVEVAAPFGPLRVLALHLLPIKRGKGPMLLRFLGSQRRRLREARVYAEYLDDTTPTVLLGDFNEDIHGLSARYFGERGFMSAMSEFGPNTPTWRVSSRLGAFGWQLDHILHNDRLETTWATVLDEGTSDHLPVVARLRPRRKLARTR